MKVLVAPKQTGKTTKILEEAASLPGYNLIVCRSQREVERLWTIIIEQKLNIPQPISFNEFMRGQFSGSRVDNFLIDQVDQLLQVMFGVKIHMVTINEDEI